MKYFVEWSCVDYESYNDEFDSQLELHEWLDKQSATAEFRVYSVIYGRRVELEPVDKVTTYRVKH